MNPTVSHRQPLMGIVISALCGILFAECFEIPLALLWQAVALAAIISLARPTAWLTHLLVVAAFFALHLTQLQDAPGKKLSVRLGERSRTASLTGTVVNEPRVSPNDFTTFLLQLDSIELDGRRQSCLATLQARWKGNPGLGDRVRLTGVIAPISSQRNPGVFDLRAYLARQDVFNGIFARYPEDGTILSVGGGNPITRAAARARTWMRVTLIRGLEDSRDTTALINGMVLGLRHEAPNDIEDSFQRTGTLHLFAVAGLHVGIIAQLLWILTALLRLPRMAAAALIIPCLFFYSAITGFHVSSLRAATMAAFLLGGIFFDRPVLALNSLAGAALLILAFNTNQLFTSGFQLSFAVVGAILVWQKGIFRILLRPAEADPFLPRSLISRSRRFFENNYRLVASSLSVSAAAWAGSLLLIAWYFYLITPISLLANLTIVPLAFCLLAVSLMSLVVATFSPALSLVFNNANWSLAQMILSLVQAFAQLPGGYAYVERPHWPTGQRAELTVLDAGAGGAVHLRTGSADWLFDTGSARDYDRFLRDYLHSRGIDRLDGLILSHGDSWHIGGANAVVDEFRPRRVIDNGAPDRSSVHRALIIRLKNRETAENGFAFGVDRDVAARVLYPPIGYKAKTADDQTLVIQLIIAGKHRVLFASDSGQKTESALLLRHDDLRSDILIKGQHSSGESGSVAFLEAVQPRLIIVTSVDFPTYERIPDSWARMVRERGIELLRQDETGAVTLDFYRDRWDATTVMTHKTFRSSSR